MTDYTQLLSAEVWAFIKETEAAYPPGAADEPVAVQRGYYNALCAKFDRPHPPRLRVENLTQNGLSMRRYHPQSPRGQVLYLHGGGFVVGGLESHDAICAEVADQAQASVLAVDYRLAPEHRHPAALHDAQAALTWLLANSHGPLVLAGDSAGATLAARLAHSNRHNARLAGQALIYPWLGAVRDTPSTQAHANAPMLTRADMDYYQALIFEHPYIANGPDLFVLNDQNVADLPPTFIVTAECDPFASDGHDYAEMLGAAKARVTLVKGEGLVHGFLRARHTVPAAARAFSNLTAAIGAMFD